MTEVPQDNFNDISNILTYKLGSAIFVVDMFLIYVSTTSLAALLQALVVIGTDPSTMMLPLPASSLTSVTTCFV